MKLKSIQSVKISENIDKQMKDRKINLRSYQLFLIALCLLFSSFIAQSANGAWYDTNWQFRQKITVLPTLADTNLSDFPYMVTITDPVNPLFASALANGDDILFADSDGTSKLDHEIEKFEISGGSEELVAWVRLPSLSASANTDIYMYYGNSGASNQENATGVWDSSYEAVYHILVSDFCVFFIKLV